MMVLLSKREYDDLVARASSVEGQVEHRLEQAKRQILSKLSQGLRDRLGPYGCHAPGSNPLQTVSELVDELLR